MSTDDYLIVGGISSGTLGEGDVTPDQAHFLALLRKVVPDWYLDPLLSTPESGYELLQAFSSVAARLALSLTRLEDGTVVAVAPAGGLAGCVVQFTRTSGGPAVTVTSGTIVTTSKNGRDFRVLQDVVFTGADNGPHSVAVEAVASGFEYNVTGPKTSAAGEALEGEIDTIKLPILSPAYGDTTLVVSQVTDAVGGTAAMLEGLGADRGIDRELGEDVEAYRLRVHSLPDVVTPDAIMRAAARILDPLGIEWEFIETFQITYQTCYDAPSPNVGTPTYQAVPPTNPDYDSNLFCLDDPRPLSLARFANLSMDLVDYRGAFFIVMKAATLLSYGFALDDPGMNPSDFRNPSTGRQRGTPAPDGTIADNPLLIYPAAYDGPDVAFDAASAALYRLLVAIKAAGVFTTLVRVPS